jgi:hypothetical protein
MTTNDRQPANDPESRPQPEKPRRLPDVDRRELSLWLAVGGTMSLVVAIWFLLLPWQLQSMIRQSLTPTGQWAVVKGNGNSDALNQLRAGLGTTQQKLQDAVTPPPDLNAQIKQAIDPRIQELKDKLKADLPAAGNNQPPAVSGQPPTAPSTTPASLTPSPDTNSASAAQP